MKDYPEGLAFVISHTDPILANTLKRLDDLGDREDLPAEDRAAANIAVGYIWGDQERILRRRTGWKGVIAELTTIGVITWILLGILERRRPS